jgi:hypothetical protein
MGSLFDMTPEEALEWARREQEKSRERFKDSPKPQISRAKREDHPHFVQTGWAFWLKAGKPVRVRREGSPPADGTLLGLREVRDRGPLALVVEVPRLGVFAARRADGVAEWATVSNWPVASVDLLEVPVTVWPLDSDADPIAAGALTASWTLQTNKLEEPDG